MLTDCVAFRIYSRPPALNSRRSGLRFGPNPVHLSIQPESRIMRSSVQYSAVAILLSCGFLSVNAAGEDSKPTLATTDVVPRQPLLTKSEVLLEDDFERTDLGEWKVAIPGFLIKNGELIGQQDRDDHGAVGRVYRNMQDVVAEFRFRLNGSRTFNVVFDDKAWKGSHAGHICRVALTSTVIRLCEDKEGVMRNDIFEMRRDPARKAESEKLLFGRSSSARVSLEQDRWYQAAIEISGDQMRVSLDGRPVGYLKSPGIAHPTKTSLHFTVTGPGVHFDDVRIWSGKR